jgi:hypothetical protein
MTQDAPTLKWLDWLTSAQQSDLDEIDAAVAAVEKEIAEKVGRLRGTLESLKQLRRVLEIKVNGPKPHKKHTKKARPVEPITAAPSANGDHNTLKLRMARLLGSQGPKTIHDIAAALNVDGRGLMPHARTDWFQRKEDGSYRLTEIGRKESGL